MEPNELESLFDFQTGDLPLVVSFPHSGTYLPLQVAEAMTGAGREVPDTDWHVPRLYDFSTLGGSPLDRCSRLAANWSRYVIDLNRPPDNQNLYPGQPTPELCPRKTFDGRDIYLPGHQPDEQEVQRRWREYWQPYHDCLQQELSRVAERFGRAVLLDLHSIASRVPRLFPGQLPDLNLGTAEGRSCGAELAREIARWLQSVRDYSGVINGRFIGGYITRRYGAPAHNVHAIQLELSQATYLDESTADWDEPRASAIRPVLKSFVDCVAGWACKA